MQQQNEIKANPIKEKLPDQEEQIPSTEDLTEATTITKTQKNTFKSEYITCKDYKNNEILVQTFPHLKSLEEAQNAKLDEIEDAYAFIIRSNNDDDIHKSIKYGVWSSTPPNNEILNEQFIKATKEGKRVFLFYSVVKSGQFVGAAELISNKHDDSFEFWWQHGRWKGLFEVKWLFIKDIPYKHFDNLQNIKDDPVIRSKDGTPVDWKKTGKKMIKIFNDFNDPNTIFNDFANMDLREQYLRYMRSMSQIQSQSMQIHQQPQGNFQGGNQPMFQQYPQGMYGMQPQMFMAPQQQQQMFQQYPRFNNAYPPQNYQNQFNNTGYFQQQSQQQQNYYGNNYQGQRYGPRNNNFNQNKPHYYKNNNQYNNNNNNNNNNGYYNNNNNNGTNYPNNGGGGYQGNKKQNRQ